MIVNIKGIIHSVRSDRLVLKAVSGYVHIMMGSDVTDREREDYLGRIGKGASVWAEKDAKGERAMQLLPAKKFVPVKVHKEYC